MANTVIALRRSDTPTAVPSNLANGEIAINYADGKLYYKNATGQIVSISGSSGNYFGTINANGTLIIADTTNDILTIDQGDNIIITSDAINDKLTINANITPAFSQANLAYDKANAANVLAKAAFDYANTVSGGTGQKFTEANSTPSSPTTGDEWLDSANGILYTYVADSNSSQWVELGPYSTYAPTPGYNLDGGTPSTIYGGLSTIDAGGVT